MVLLVVSLIFNSNLDYNLKVCNAGTILKLVGYKLTFHIHQSMNVQKNIRELWDIKSIINLAALDIH